MNAAALLYQRNRFFAKGAVVVNQGDFFTLEFLPATFFFGNGLQDGVSRHPIGASDREIPLEYCTIRAFTAAVTNGQHRDFVARRFFSDGKCRACRQGLHKAGVLAFEAFITFDAACGVIAGFAFFIRNFHAIDTAFGIDQFEVIHKAIGPRCAVGCIGASAVGQHGHELFFGLCQHGCGSRQSKSRDQRRPDKLERFIHHRLLQN